MLLWIVNLNNYLSAKWSIIELELQKLLGFRSSLFHQYHWLLLSVMLLAKQSAVDCSKGRCVIFEQASDDCRAWYWVEINDFNQVINAKNLTNFCSIIEHFK